MEKYANIKTYPLRYSDFDFKDELKLSALLELTQESAGASAEELGFGYHTLKRDRRGFIVVATVCRFRRPIVLGDCITVETWPLPPRHVIFERDYRITDADGKEAAVLASRWCLVDLDTFSMLLPERLGEVHARCPYRAEKALEVTDWKIPRLTGGREVYRLTVQPSHCDHYGHANNARYADFFLDAFSSEELSARTVTGFRIAYLKQAKEGSELTVFREDREGESVLEIVSEGEAITRFSLTFAQDIPRS